MTPTVRPLGNGRFEVSRGTAHRVAYAIRHGADTWVFLDGRVHIVRAPAAATPRSARTDDQAALAAPMPSTVIAINVAPDQQVARGDVLVTLEAMKMELAIAAPRDATVRRIACRVGELVQPGVPLLELE